MQRRHALSLVASLGSGLLLGPTRLWAAPPSGARLLVVFLRGAYDACNLLVPTGSNFYYETRREIAIARPSTDPASTLPLDDGWGLHPALRETIYPLYQNGQATFIPFAGTHDLSRSHFETQDSIEQGRGPDSRGTYGSGFLNRLAGVISGVRPMAFTDQLPMVFQGEQRVPNTALRTLGRSSVDARQSQLIASMYQGTSLGAQVQEGFAVRDEVMRDMSAEMEASGRNAVSSKGFEAEAKRIARLMADGYNLGFVDIGGWDTHINQGGAQGYLANRLEELGAGLAAYAQEMGPAWRDTTVVVISEFGRTFRQNGSRGTDHGHGTVYWVLGGGVRGHRIAGVQQRLERETLFQDRDLPVLNEYRAIFGGLAQRLYGLSASQLDTVFPGAAPRDLGLV